jgi:hypothetical protein
MMGAHVSMILMLPQSGYLFAGEESTNLGGRPRGDGGGMLRRHDSLFW